MLNKIVDLAIKENMRIRKLNPGLKAAISDRIYLQDNCTIHINIGRATGKTQYIIDNAKENDVVIVCSKMHKNLFFEKYKTKNVFYSTNDLIGKRFDNADFIYIDEPALFFKKQNCDLWDIYDLFHYTKPSVTFVLLGE
jgi:hypothetical protein